MSKPNVKKFTRALLTLSLLSFSLMSYPQSDLPRTMIKTTKGKTVSFSSLCQARDTVILVTFWATWCMPCMDELESLNELYPGWQRETAFRFIAVSVDDARTSSRVSSFVKGKGWTFDVYLDPNNDLKRALNINDVPYLIIIKNGVIRYQKNGFLPGSETELLEKIRSL